MPLVTRTRREAIPTRVYNDPRIIPEFEYREVEESFWQFEDGGLIPYHEYLRYMPRPTSSREWYDRRAAARDPNRELTEEVRRAEARAERERWERNLEEERRRRSVNTWGSRSAWSIVDEVSTFQNEHTAAQRADLMEWYRRAVNNTSGISASTYSGTTSGRITINTGPIPRHDDWLDSASFFASPLPPPAMFDPADLDKPLVVGDERDYPVGVAGYLDEAHQTVRFFVDRGHIPFAHTARILVRYFGTAEKAKALVAGNNVTLVLPDRIERTNDLCRSMSYDGFDSGTLCLHVGRSTYMLFKDGAWHIRAKNATGSLHWEPLDPETL